MPRYWIAGLALVGLAAGAARAADAAFDARRPADVAAVITTHGASGAMTTKDGETFFAGQAGQLNFSVHFQDCNDGKTLCNTVMMSEWWDTKAVTLDQINQWNRWTVYCPGYIDSDGNPEVWSFGAVSAKTDPDDLATDVNQWMGCLSDFDRFVANPDEFLKKVNASPAPDTSTSPPPPPPGGHAS
jgi:hypothetical protein